MRNNYEQCINQKYIYIDFKYSYRLFSRQKILNQPLILSRIDNIYTHLIQKRHSDSDTEYFYFIKLHNSLANFKILQVHFRLTRIKFTIKFVFCIQSLVLHSMNSVLSSPIVFMQTNLAIITTGFWFRISLCCLIAIYRSFTQCLLFHFFIQLINTSFRLIFLFHLQIVFRVFPSGQN